MAINFLLKFLALADTDPNRGPVRPRHVTVADKANVVPLGVPTGITDIVFRVVRHYSLSIKDGGQECDVALGADIEAMVRSVMEPQMAIATWTLCLKN